ncbi:MAG: hypothetical protein GFH27_549305n209 [Chloroflexi bacterium AL-W]|nr:hypothetical protein [Chloroflexi bacterium AL-N1]NOK71227.1 hypothetical protein [Chloroflexi bacterium AL-N10]NOK76516.1 hypothetical protein [Chloroflexi bacterium AL-N5]NOK83633.1 hypothetical protein [Chloroflexi bacterium AL-W]NOK92245.1 hypothetical protein [Chloroflexi bacterium AL-N15]
MTDKQSLETARRDERRGYYLRWCMLLIPFGLIWWLTWPPSYNHLGGICIGLILGRLWWFYLRTVVGPSNDFNPLKPIITCGMYLLIPVSMVVVHVLDMYFRLDADAILFNMWFLGLGFPVLLDSKPR